MVTKFKINDRLLYIILVFVVVVTSCNDDCMIIDPNADLTGKIKSLFIDINASYDYQYTFVYDETDGRLISIFDDTLEICSITYWEPDSLKMSWSAVFFPIIYKEWLVTINESNKLSTIYESTYDLNNENFRAVYDEFDLLDTLYEVDIDAFNLTNISDHSYQFINGNCSRFSYSFNNLSGGNTKLVEMDYTQINFSKYIPRQQAYRHMSQDADFNFFLDPLYVLGMLGVNCVTPNVNLIATRNDDIYAYELDSLNRVNHMVMTVFDSGDTLAVMDLEYY